MRTLAVRGHETHGLYRRDFPSFDPLRHYLWDGREFPVEVLDGVEGVIHAAGAAHCPRAPAEFFDQGNRELTHSVVWAVSKTAVPVLIHLSSIAADANVRFGTETSYGRSKREAEAAVEALRGSGKLGVNLRPPLIYGPGAPGNWAKLVRLARSRAPLPFAIVRNRRYYLGIDNLASAVAAVLEVASRTPDENATGLGARPARLASKSGNYVVADSAPLSLAEVVKILREALGRRPGLFAFPPSILGQGLRLCGKSAMADGLFGDLVLDSAPFRNTFGWVPPLSSPEGMAASITCCE